MADQRETTGYMALLGDAPASSSGGGWLSGLLGGGGSPLDLYGDLFTPEQKKALQQRELSQGLFRMAEKLGQAAQPQRVPVNTLGALGSALGAFGTGSDITEQALKGMQTAEQVRALKQKRDLAAKVLPFFWKTAGGDILQSPSDTPPAPGAVPLGPAPAAPGAPTGGPLASNAPPPPPGGAPSQIGLPGPGLSPFGLPDTSQIGLPPPGTSPFGLPPGQQSGLLPPPPGANPQMGQGGGLLAGLPFDQTAPGAGGDDLSNIRVEQLSGEAAPAGVDLPFPTRANPNKPKSAWEQGYTYDAPKVPFGQDPGDVLPGSDRDARLAALTRQYESGDRNIMQRVNATSTSGGYYQINDPTWRDIAPKAGIDLAKYPRAIDAPREVQDAAAKALRETRGMQPWASNKPLMAAVGSQDTVIPSGRGIPASALQRVADTGAPGAVPGMPSAAAAAAVTAGGKIPGLNMTPQQLASFNAMFEMAGLGDPFKSLLDTYYKSPAYLMQAEGAKALGALPFEGPKAAAIAAAQQQYIQQNATHQSDLDIAKELLTKGGLVQMPDGSYKQITSIQEGLAAVDIAKEKFKSENEQVTATITLPGEARPREVPMTRAQFAMVSKGLAVPELGIPAMSGVKLGKPVYNPTETALGPVEAKAIFDNQQLATDAATTIETNKEARRLLDSGVITGFGADRVTALSKLGNALKLSGRSTQETVANTESYLATTAGNVGRMIKQFGSGTGLSDADREYAAQMAAGRVTLDETSIRRILDINDRASLNIINRHNQRVSGIAPGATLTPLTVPVPTPYTPPLPTATGPKGEKLILRDGQWVPQ